MKSSTEHIEALQRRARELAEVRKHLEDTNDPRSTFLAIEAATRYQVRHSTACRILAGKTRQPKEWQLNLIAEALGVRPSQARPVSLDGEQVTPRASQSETGGIRIPMAGRAAADTSGGTRVEFDHEGDALELPERLGHVEIRGDSLRERALAYKIMEAIE